MEIDPRPLQALLTQAHGQYERDKALLENANIDRFATDRLQQECHSQTATRHATGHGSTSSKA